MAVPQLFSTVADTPTASRFQPQPLRGPVTRDGPGVGAPMGGPRGPGARPGDEAGGSV